MGNEFCDVVGFQPEYKRTQLSHLMTPSNDGDKVALSEPYSRTNSQVFQLSQETKINYRGYIIKCKNKDIRYSKSLSQTNKVPFINGFAKVYNKQNEHELIFQGELKNSKFNGFGKLHKNGKVVYEGQFKNNLFDGWGITPQYTGQFRQGLYDGYGIYQQFQNIDRKIVTFYYQGYFQSGLYSGSGVLIKGSKWPVTQIKRIHDNEGIFDFLNGQIEYGMDIIKVYGARQIYIGQFSNGFRHGFGRLFTQKIQFSGQFSHNLYHGLGTIYNNTNEGKRVVQSVFRMGKQFKQ